MSTKHNQTPGAVGYKNPPTHTRFKQGKSGNPKGRRKGQRSVEDLMVREAGRVVKVKTSDGCIERLTKHEVLIRQLWKLALQGDLRAQRLVLTHLEPALLNSAEAGSQDESGAVSLT